MVPDFPNPLTPKEVSGLLHEWLFEMVQLPLATALHSRPKHKHLYSEIIPKKRFPQQREEPHRTGRSK